MEEASKRKWDVGLGIVAPVLTVVGVLIGVWKFTAEQSNLAALQIRSDAIAFERDLWKQQLSSYAGIATVVGQIASNAEDHGALDASVKKFRELYWGAMVLAEDRAVASAMIAFNQEIQDFQSGWSSSSNLKKRAHKLLEICRESSRTAWKNLELLRDPTNSAVPAAG